MLKDFINPNLRYRTCLVPGGPSPLNFSHSLSLNSSGETSLVSSSRGEARSAYDIELPSLH